MEDATRRDEISERLEAHVRQFAGLLNHARRRHGLATSDLDELVQEVRLRLWRAQQTGDRIASVSSSYMYRTAMSAAVDLIRRRRHEARETSLPEEGAGDGHGTLGRPMADPAEAGDLTRKLDEAISSLQKPRAVAVRLYLAGYPREEIGELMGWTEAKARNLIYRGLSDLRLRLVELGVGPEGVR